MTQSYLQISPQTWRVSPIARRIIALAAVLVLISNALFAQSRTQLAAPTIPSVPIQRQRDIAINGPAILNNQQLSALRVNNEQARLLQMYPFDIMWGLP